LPPSSNLRPFEASVGTGGTNSEVSTALQPAPNRVAGHAPATADSIPLRPSGFGKASKKTVVNLRDLTAAGRTTGGRPFGPAVQATRAKPRLASPVTTVDQITAAASFTPTVDANFPGLSAISGNTGPADPNAAASPTQIVEVVNVRLQVYTRSGATACASVDLDTFFERTIDEFFTDPRVIYDNVNNKFTVILTVETTVPDRPHLPPATLLLAHTVTGDACGSWTKYSLNGVVPDNYSVDQPVIGQDRDAFLFGGYVVSNNGLVLPYYIAFSYPKSCAYAGNNSCTFPTFRPDDFATPASSGGNPMITTAHSYFVASVPNVGYKLWQMDNSGNTGATSFTFQGIIANGQLVVPPPRNAQQPLSPDPINIGASAPVLAVRIKSTPIFDGTRNLVRTRVGRREPSRGPIWSHRPRQ